MARVEVEEREVVVQGSPQGGKNRLLENLAVFPADQDANEYGKRKLYDRSIRVDKPSLERRIEESVPSHLREFVDVEKHDTSPHHVKQLREKEPKYNPPPDRIKYWYASDAPSVEFREQLRVTKQKHSALQEEAKPLLDFSDGQTLFDEITEKKLGEHSVIVSNLDVTSPSSTVENDLRFLADQFGSVSSCEVFSEEEKRFGRISFSSADIATNAQEKLNGKSLYGHKLEAALVELEENSSAWTTVEERVPTTSTRPSNRDRTLVDIPIHPDDIDYLGPVEIHIQYPPSLSDDIVKEALTKIGDIKSFEPRLLDIDYETLINKYKPNGQPEQVATFVQSLESLLKYKLKGYPRAAVVKFQDQRCHNIALRFGELKVNGITIPMMAPKKSEEQETKDRTHFAGEKAKKKGQSRPITKLHIGGLKDSTSREYLISVFDKFGSVKSCVISRPGDKNRKPRAWITYYSPEDAQKALRQRSLTIDGRKISVYADRNQPDDTESLKKLEEKSFSRFGSQNKTFGLSQRNFCSPSRLRQGSSRITHHKFGSRFACHASTPTSLFLRKYTTSNLVRTAGTRLYRLLVTV